jgi:hypothetical protein
MSKSKDKPPPQVASGDAEAKQSGRVAFDSRGNPTWEWQTSTGVFGRDVSTQRLKKLEAKDLALLDTQTVEKPKKLELEDAPLPGGGCNPYNSNRPSSPPPKPSLNPAAKPLPPSTGPLKEEWWAKKKPKRG